MKGAFESFTIFLFGMIFFLLGISLYNLNYQFHQARIFQESIINTIEGQARFDHDVEQTFKKEYCPNCSYQIEKEGEVFNVKVSFPIEIPLLKFKKDISLDGFTYEIKQIN